MLTSLYRLVHRLTRSYPFRTPSYELNVLLGWLGLDARRPRWLLAPPRADVPALALNVADRYHRKHYFFPKAYWRDALAQPLARFLAATLRRGDTYLDIGAHLGLFALHAARLVGATGRVVAFEPDPMTVRSLTETAAANSSAFDVVPMGLSDEEGEAVLFRAAAQAHSLVPGREDDARYSGESATVRVTTLDRWATEQRFNPENLRVVKVDVEGLEARTLAGARECLVRCGRPTIWCEVRGPNGSTRAPGTFAQVVDVLAPLGYRPCRWSPAGETPVTVADVDQREDIVFRA